MKICRQDIYSRNEHFEWFFFLTIKLMHILSHPLKFSTPWKHSEKLFFIFHKQASSEKKEIWEKWKNNDVETTIKVLSQKTQINGKSCWKILQESFIWFMIEIEKHFNQTQINGWFSCEAKILLALKSKWKII